MSDLADTDKVDVPRGWSGGSIRVGTSTPKKWNPLSPLIRWTQKADYSHIWMLLDDVLFDTDMVLEEGKEGFQLVPFEKFAAENKIIKIYKPDETYHLEVGLKLSVAYIGDPYDERGLIGMLWVTICKWFKRQVRNPLASKRMMFCSESVAWILTDSNVPEAKDLDPEACTPKQVVEVLERMRT